MSVPILRRMLVDWRAKLSCLVVATLLWIVIDHGVSPKRDPRHAMMKPSPATPPSPGDLYPVIPGAIIAEPPHASSPQP